MIMIRIKIVRTFVANRRDVNDSFKWAARGDKLRTICNDELKERSNNSAYRQVYSQAS